MYSWGGSSSRGRRPSIYSAIRSHPYTPGLARLDAVRGPSRAPRHRPTISGRARLRRLRTPLGCPFHPRCPVAEQRCTTSGAGSCWRKRAGSTRVACHLIQSEIRSETVRRGWARSIAQANPSARIGRPHRGGLHVAIEAIGSCYGESKKAVGTCLLLAVATPIALAQPNTRIEARRQRGTTVLGRLPGARPWSRISTLSRLAYTPEICPESRIRNQQAATFAPIRFSKRIQLRVRDRRRPAIESVSADGGHTHRIREPLIKPLEFSGDIDVQLSTLRRKGAGSSYFIRPQSDFFVTPDGARRRGGPQVVAATQFYETDLHRDSSTVPILRRPFGKDRRRPSSSFSPAGNFEISAMPISRARPRLTIQSPSREPTGTWLPLARICNVNGNSR